MQLEAMSKGELRLRADIYSDREMTVDFDPAYLPCHLQSFYFYSLLAMNRSKP